MLTEPPIYYGDLEVRRTRPTSWRTILHPYWDRDRPAVRPLQTLQQRFDGSIPSLPPKFLQVDTPLLGVWSCHLTHVSKRFGMLTIVAYVGKQEDRVIDTSLSS
jgi:hypothetical protein